MNEWERIALKNSAKEIQSGVVGDGKTVLVHYVGKLNDGMVFDSSMDRARLELTIGKGNTIPGFVKGITGMRLGEKKTFTIPPEEGYGSRREDLILTITREDFPSNIVPDIGKILQLKDGIGGFINAVVIDVENDNITLDANHPLAGETLIFEVEVVGIR
jgi:peptidylprolyl isomerase